MVHKVVVTNQMLLVLFGYYHTWKKMKQIDGNLHQQPLSKGLIEQILYLKNFHKDSEKCLFPV